METLTTPFEHDFKASEVILANYTAFKTPELEKTNYKKLIPTLLAVFVIFSLFAYGLRLVDQKYNSPQEEIQVLENFEEQQIYSNNSISDQFKNGYIGNNLIIEDLAVR